MNTYYIIILYTYCTFDLDAFGLFLFILFYIDNAETFSPSSFYVFLDDLTLLHSLIIVQLIYVFQDRIGPL